MGAERLDEVPLATLRGTAEAAVATWFVPLACASRDSRGGCRYVVCIFTGGVF